MIKKNLPKKYFVGKVFLPSEIDDQRSFASQIMKVENDPIFNKWIEKNNFKQRSSLIVFGPETFMFWYGVLIDQDIDFPEKFSKYELPEAKVVEFTTENSDLNYFNQPINISISAFLKKLDQKNVTYHENMGEAENPYIISKVDLDTKKLTQILFLDASSEDNI